MYRFKFKDMIKSITNFLKAKPSYLKKGNTYLASKFNCSTKTIENIKRNLADVKRNYIASL